MNGPDISRLLPPVVVSNQIPPDEIWLVAIDEKGESMSPAKSSTSILGVSPDELERKILVKTKVFSTESVVGLVKAVERFLARDGRGEPLEDRCCLVRREDLSEMMNCVNTLRREIEKAAWSSIKSMEKKA